MTDVPLVDLRAHYATLREEIRAAVDRVLDAQRFILGDEVRAFERELAAFVGADHAVGVSSGTDALTVALMAAGVGPGTEVVTTPFTFLSTVECVVRLGARPVYVDLGRGDVHLDIRAVEGALTPRTKAIVPVHLFGGCMALSAVAELARSHGIFLVEDAAQAIGAKRGGRTAGTFGHLSAFSFFPTKNLGAFGDAGAVVTSDGELAERVRQLRGHGQSARYVAAVVGGNFRLDEIQAAVLRVKLRHLTTWNEQRRANAARYDELLGAAAKRSEGRLLLPSPARDEHHVFHHYVVRSRRRDALRDALAAQGIATEIHYPLAMHRQPAWSENVSLPEAEAATREVVSLPVHAELRPDQLARVAAAVAAFVEETR